MSRRVCWLAAMKALAERARLAAQRRDEECISRRNDLEEKAQNLTARKLVQR